MPIIVPAGPVPPEQVAPEAQESIEASPEQGAPLQEGGEVATPEQKQEVLDMIEAVRSKLGNYGANKFANDNKLDAIRSSLLKQVFEKLQLAGVDLSDRNSVAMFIAKLKQQSPELAEDFEKAMNVLLGGEGVPSAPEDPTQDMDLGVPPQDDMNNEEQTQETDQVIS